MKELKEKILEKISEKELEERIKAKIEKFSGMLNEEGALFLIARENAINLEQENTVVSKLKKGNSINFEGEILSVYPEREFESKGKKGKVKNILVKDSSGTAFMVLWNGDTEKIKQEDEGKKIELKDFIVEEYNGKKQLKKGFNGIIELKEKIKEEAMKISDLIEGEKNISVKGRILIEFPLKEFESKGKKGMLKRIELIDETGIIRIVLWDEKAKLSLKEGNGILNEGNEIELTALNARKGLNEIELHSSFNTTIKETKGLGELKDLCISFFGLQELNKVIEGKRIVVAGKIKELNKTKLLFNVCPECGKKIEEEDNKFFCNTCGQVLKPDRKAVISFELEDNSAVMRTIVYGKKAEEILGKNNKEIEDKLDEIILDEVLIELNEKIKGKELSFLAKVKENPFDEETELVLEKLF